jgi:hypothetical protein
MLSVADFLGIILPLNIEESMNGFTITKNFLGNKEVSMTKKNSSSSDCCGKKELNEFYSDPKTKTVDAVQKNPAKQNEKNNCENGAKFSFKKIKKIIDMFFPTLPFMSHFIKYAAISILCSVFFLIINSYYQLVYNCEELSHELNIFVFYSDNNLVSQSRKSIDETNLVIEKEFLESQEAYRRAVDNIPHLGDAAAAGIVSSIPAYSVFEPSFSIEQNSVLRMKTILENIPGVDEVVYNSNVFSNYEEIQNLLTFYKNILIAFSVVISSFFFLRCFLLIIGGQENIKDLAVKIFKCFFSSGISFFFLWLVFVYFQFPLFISDSACIGVISISALLGIILI